MNFKRLKKDIQYWDGLNVDLWLLKTLMYCSLLIPFQTIFSHGTVTDPPSRVWNCFQENPESPDSAACEAAIIGYGTQAFYDWSEVARMDAGGMHREIIQDGNLASAGRPDKFGGLDQVRDDWVATPVTAGPFQITWTLVAPHQTLYYDVFITKADWTPDQPLTWDSLELLVRTDPRPAAATDVIDLVLPQRTGKHVLYSVWQRSLTPEAFYSTSDIDFGNVAVEPMAPVASFTSENTNRCGGPEVAFDASDSFDGNGDDLTYTWDFGDGTTGEGEEVLHTFPDGLDSATVTLTVSDNEFSSGSVESVNLAQDPDCSEIACPFGTPRESSIPVMYYRSYNKSQNGSITVHGENGPDLTPIRKLDIAYTNNEINTFFINEWSADQGLGGNGANIFPDTEHTFTGANPMLTVSNSGIENFDGSYYVNVIENDEFGSNFSDFVMVSTTGRFSIYFTYSSVSPECDGDDTGTIIEMPDAVSGGTITGGPFVFTVGDGIADNVSNISLSGNIGDNSQWLVTDSLGNILGLPTTIEEVDFDDAGEGRCFIYNISYDGEIGGLAVGNNTSTLTGDFDFSNSIDVDRILEGEVTFENVVYNETVDGDLSVDNTAPTAVDLNIGDNRVISSQTGIEDQANFFTIEIPEGYELSQLVVDSFMGADDTGFIGIDEGPIISGQPANNAPSRLIGGLSYGTANVGTDILPAMGQLDNPAAGFVEGFGFTPPLPSGEYTVWLNQTGGTSNTTLNFVLTEVETDDVSLENVVYNETVDGDLSSDNTAPTVIELAHGDNRVISSQTGTEDQANFLTFSIPNGLELSQLVVDSFVGVDDTGFIGIDEGVIISGEPASNAPARLIGGLSYGTANVGTDILPAMGQLDNPAAGFVEGFGFTPPLPSGQYTVWLNQTGGTSTTTVNFVLSEVETEIETPVDTEESCSFNTPLATALPSTGHAPYENIHVLGANGPNMDNVRRFTVNWDLPNNGLYQFSFDMDVAPWYANFSTNTQNFNEANPSITLVNTPIEGLDGTYFATLDGDNFVLVGETFTLYFSNSETAPECIDSFTAAKSLGELSFLTMYPNPAVSSVTLQSEKDLINSSITITDLNGKTVQSLAINENATSVVIDLDDMSAGLYLVQVFDSSGFSRIMKLIVN